MTRRSNNQKIRKLIASKKERGRTRYRQIGIGRDSFRVLEFFGSSFQIFAKRLCKQWYDFQLILMRREKILASRWRRFLNAKLENLREVAFDLLSRQRKNKFIRVVRLKKRIDAELREVQVDLKWLQSAQSGEQIAERYPDLLESMPKPTNDNAGLEGVSVEYLDDHWSIKSDWKNRRRRLHLNWFKEIQKKCVEDKSRTAELLEFKLSKIKRWILDQNTSDGRREFFKLRKSLRRVAKRRTFLRKLRSFACTGMFVWIFAFILALKSWFISRRNLNFMSIGFGSILSPTILSIGSCTFMETPLKTVVDKPITVFKGESELGPIRILQDAARTTNGLGELPIHWVEGSSTQVMRGYSGRPVDASRLAIDDSVCKAEMVVIVGRASSSGGVEINQEIARLRSEYFSDVIYDNCGGTAEQIHLQIALHSPDFASNDGIQRTLSIYAIDDAVRFFEIPMDMRNVVSDLFDNSQSRYKSQSYTFRSRTQINGVASKWQEL
ncbi:MAG: hypothetical protein ACRBEQ_00095 [Hyphomonas sp.]